MLSALLCAAAVLWSLSAGAQQIKSIKLGFVSWHPAAQLAHVEYLRESLGKLGYIEGKNIEIEPYFTNGNRERTQEVIRALLQKGVDILVVRATPVAHIAKEATRTTPIVMVVADPLATGLVQSLSHPGGNLTGLSMLAPDLTGKRFELLREIRPSVRAVAFLGSSKDPNGPTFARETKAAAERMGLNVLLRFIEGPAAIDEGVFQAMKAAGAEAVFVQPIFTGHQDKIVKLAMKSHLPVIADFPLFAEAGALLSFGTDEIASAHRVAYYVDRIARGARPAELPIEQPTTFQLVVNVRAANTLGWTIPPLLLARADKVIE